MSFITSCVNVGVQGPQHVCHIHREAKRQLQRQFSHILPHGGQPWVLPWHCDVSGGITSQMASRVAGVGLSMLLLWSSCGDCA